MLIGVAIGFAVGILPGLGGPTTLALMLPFVLKMTPVEAFAFLLGMLSVTNTTGDITSILFGIPGEPTSAATIVDGHAMAKRGEAGRALGAAMMSSLVGAIFGALVLGLAIPIVRPLVLAFGSPEFFMLSVLGITFVASLSGGALLRGLVAGGLGLWLATIGLDPMTGIQRYTFGQLFLWDGIGLVPVTIGFYAIPELVDLAVQRSSISQVDVSQIGGVWQGVRDTFRHWFLVLRCSAVGTFVSVIPGLGAATTRWLAYAHAVQSSPGRGRFGRGAVEGVLGPGAANNSTLGGSLVTTVAFGVPASVSTAILMGAFFIQGLVPGPADAGARSKGPPGRDAGDGVDDRDRQRGHGGGLPPVHGPPRPHHTDPRGAPRAPHTDPRLRRRLRREERLRGPRHRARVWRARARDGSTGMAQAATPFGAGPGAAGARTGCSWPPTTTVRRGFSGRACCSSSGSRSSVWRSRSCGDGDGRGR